MQVGIDFNHGITRLAYRRDGEWHYHLIPQSDSGDNSTGEKNLVNHLADVYAQCIDEQLESAVFSYPHYWDMALRCRLFRAAQSTFNSMACYMIPGPIAALWGSPCTSSVLGDVLVIDLQEKLTSFSLLTVSQGGREICLESQLPTSYDETPGLAFDKFINNKLRIHAEQLGFYDSGLWKLDSVIMIGQESRLDQAVPIVQSCFANINLVIPKKAEFQLVRGLACWGEMKDSRPRVRFIYPFKFYLEASGYNESNSNPGASLLFDTANLPLDLGERCLLAALVADSDYNLSPQAETVHYRLFEKSLSYCDSQDYTCSEPRLVWEFQESRANTPDPLGIYFNTRQFIIESDLVGQTDKEKPELPDITYDYHRAVQRLLAIPFLEPRLKADLQALVDKSGEYDLDEQLELTRLRLLTLLQLLPPS
jgi:hypothetical protein